MFIELTATTWDQEKRANVSTHKFLMHFQSGWEIHDNGFAGASWANHNIGMGKDTGETYDEIKQKLAKAGLLIGE